MILLNQVMRQFAGRFDRRGAGPTFANSVESQRLNLFLAVEEHVLFPGEMIENRHSANVSSCSDFVDRYGIEAPLKEQTGRCIRDALAGCQTLAGASVGFFVHQRLLLCILSIYWN